MGLSPDGTKLFIGVFKGWSDTKYYYKDLKKEDNEFILISGEHKANLGITPRDCRFLRRSNNNAPKF